MKIEDFKPNNEFTRIEWERSNLADSHWWAMCRKHNTNDYTQWQETLEYPDGSTSTFTEVPLPRGGNYERVFFGRIFNGTASGVVSYLEGLFQKDEVDLCYIEGLLEDAIELGLTQEGTVYLMSGEGANSLWQNVHPDQVEQLSGYGNTKRFVGGASIASRIDLVRRWIKRTRKENKRRPDTMSVKRLPVAPARDIPAIAQQASTPPPPAEAYPWAEIDALAERIGLRLRGQFVPAPNRIAAATAGMIDALCEAEILPPSGELERLYTAFTHHYGRSIKADRVTPTRAAWQKKARTGLGLE